MRKMMMLGAAMAALMIPLAAEAASPIKLGVLEDQSGDFALATIGKVHGIQLATDEINKAGGIGGRPDPARDLRYAIRQHALSGIHATRAAAR